MGECLRHIMRAGRAFLAFGAPRKLLHAADWEQASVGGRNFIEREKRELRQALGTLTSATTYATARLDQHQERATTTGASCSKPTTKPSRR